MHMSDALISPAVGTVMLAAGAACLAFSTAKETPRLRLEEGEKKIPMMGIMGAFVFAAQMINFTIPGTGSSGHLTGALLLCGLLGPYAGFLTMACILAIQALFFADGGLLAYGCNLMNMGFYTCFILYPFLFRRMTANKRSGGRIMAASVITAIIALQLGAFSVVLETVLSGRTELPFQVFVWFMQPIHLAIGLVEGIVTGAILCFVHRAMPQALDFNSIPGREGRPVHKKAWVLFTVLALLAGCVLSQLASSYPDGLEWSMGHVLQDQELVSREAVQIGAEAVQEKTAFMPDYSFGSPQPARIETSLAGLIGGAATFLAAALFGVLIWLAKRRRQLRSPGQEG